MAKARLLPAVLALLPSTGCVLWTGKLNPDGYARVRVGDHKVYAHRRVYELVVGPIPDGLELDHLCRVRHCVNPIHLEPVTHRVNNLRGEAIPALNARKTTCQHGHPFDYVSTRGERICRTCRNRRVREHEERRRDQVPSSA